MRMQGHTAISQEAIENNIYYWSRGQRQMFATRAHTRFNHCGCVAMCRGGLMDCSVTWVELCGINIRGPDSDWMPSNVWGLMCSLVDSALCFLKMWKVIIADVVYWIVQTTWIWVPLAVSTSVFLPCPSPTPEIRTSSRPRMPRPNFLSN